MQVLLPCSAVLQTRIGGIAASKLWQACRSLALLDFLTHSQTRCYISGIVHIFWDLDNKPGDGLQLGELVSRVKMAAEQFGEVSKLALFLRSTVMQRGAQKAFASGLSWLAIQVAEMHAYANTSTLTWVPPAERRRRGELKARSVPSLRLLLPTEVKVLDLLLLQKPHRHEHSCRRLRFTSLQS